MAFLDYDGLTSFWEKVKMVITGKQDAISVDDSLHFKDGVLSVTQPVKRVTKAEYDALSETEKNHGIYIITDANINLNDRGDIYSTEETRIGTWIDGKTLYRKVFYIKGNIKPGSRIAVGDVSGFDFSMATGLSATRSDGPIHITSMTYNSQCVIPYISNNSLFVTIGGFTLTAFTIVLAYTKTADPEPVVSSVSTQSFSINSLSSDSQSSEKVLASSVPLPSSIIYAPASASASASSVNFTFAPASASSTSFAL